MSEIWNSRTELLIGKENIEKLKAKHVLIAGLGGVGGYVAEMLARAGIGELTIIDSDVVSITNINRQIIASTKTIDLSKIELFSLRLQEINPKIKLNCKNLYLKDELIDNVLSHKYDYVVDAIDTLTPKINFIETALKYNLKLISSLGAGAKLDPSKVQISDISKSYNDNLAKILRKRLHRIGIRTGFKVVFSSENVIKTAIVEVENEQNKKSKIGSISYMPAIFGIYIASEIIREFIDI